MGSLSAASPALAAVQGQYAAEDAPRRVAIVANPYSGRRENRRLVEALAGELARHGLQPQLMWQPAELREAATQADFARHFRCVVAAGGDGTLQRVVNEQTAVPVYAYPLGNENLFARHFGHVRQPEAAAAAMARGAWRTIDLARATYLDSGTRLRFCSVASIGFDADVCHRLAAWRSRGTALRRVGARSYVLPIAASVCSYTFPTMTIEAEGRMVQGAMVLVFNLPEYAFGLPFLPMASPADGLLDWIVFRRPGRWAVGWYLLALCLRRHLRQRGVAWGRARRVRVTCASGVPLQTDGEASGFGPVELAVEPGGLRVIEP